MKFLLLFILALLLCFGFCTQAAADETMLMFVGESEPVTTVASRTPEAPTTAPAMVTLVERAQIEERGYRTLAELLDDQPGFYLQLAGRGSVPYLRGLRDSVLFLYDGVPMTTDVTKSFASLDQEMSLELIERVEIVYGAGSVLWGPDAFAGVVNLVPRRANKKRGAEINLNGGNLETYGGGLALESTAKQGDFFIGGRQLQTRHHVTTVTADPETGVRPVIHPSSYQELVGTLNIGHWLHFSGRWSDFDHNYSQNDAASAFSWVGNRQAPFSFLRLNLQTDYGASHFKLSGFLSRTRYLVQDADLQREQSNQVAHLELLTDRRFFKRGLLTVGASWRQNRVNNALVQDGFLPDFINTGDSLFTPVVKQKDFSSSLFSAYAQFRYRWIRNEAWIGLRRDSHSQYPQTTSYSLGFYQPFSEKLQLKTAFGTAFRSPWSSQLFDDQQFDPEEVQTLSSQLSYTPLPGQQMSLTLYYSRLFAHRAEDPYGGLSQPERRNFYGAEVHIVNQISQQLRLRWSVSAQGVDQNNDRYSVLAFSFVRPDGTRVDEYESWTQPIEQGPAWQAKVSGDWRPRTNQFLSLGLNCGASFRASDNKGELIQRYPSPLLVNLTYQYRGLFGRDRVTLRVTNLFDHDYKQPDQFGPSQAPPRRFSLNYTWAF